MQRMNVMDFGAGTGLITSQIAGKVDKVTAVDVSRAMLDKLMAKSMRWHRITLSRQEYESGEMAVFFQNWLIRQYDKVNTLAQLHAD